MWAPTGLTAPHDWQPRGASVISFPSASTSTPAMAFPSSVISASCRSEALGVDRGRLVPEPDEQVGARFDEGRRPADEDVRRGGRRGPHRGEHVGVDAPVEALPAGGGAAGQRGMEPPPPPFPPP